MSARPGRLLRARNFLAAALLALGAIGYPIAWSLDPFIWGVLLIGLGPVQIGVAMLGAVARAGRGDQRGALGWWIIDALLFVMAGSGYLFARTISWT